MALVERRIFYHLCRLPRLTPLLAQVLPWQFNQTLIHETACATEIDTAQCSEANRDATCPSVSGSHNQLNLKLSKNACFQSNQATPLPANIRGMHKSWPASIPKSGEVGLAGRHVGSRLFQSSAQEACDVSIPTVSKSSSTGSGRTRPAREAAGSDSDSDSGSDSDSNPDSDRESHRQSKTGVKKVVVSGKHPIGTGGVAQPAVLAGFESHQQPETDAQHGVKQINASEHAESAALGDSESHQRLKTEEQGAKQSTSSIDASEVAKFAAMADSW